MRDWQEKRAEEAKEKRLLRDIEESRYQAEKQRTRRKAAHEFGEARAEQDVSLERERMSAEFSARKAAVRRQARARYAPRRSTGGGMFGDSSGGLFGGIIPEPSRSTAPRRIGKPKTRYIVKGGVAYPVKGRKTVRKSRTQPQGQSLNDMIMPPMAKKKSKKMDDMWW